MHVLYIGPLSIQHIPTPTYVLFVPYGAWMYG